MKVWVDVRVILWLALQFVALSSSSLPAPRARFILRFDGINLSSFLRLRRGRGTTAGANRERCVVP